jgi:hypothetical protein
LKNSPRKEIDDKEEQEMRKLMLEAFENEDRYQFKDLVAYCSGKLGTIPLVAKTVAQPKT